MQTVAFALGGNLGDVRMAFAGVIRTLRQHPQIRDIHPSGVYRTAAVGERAGDDFLNAAVVASSNLTPAELLALCQQCEADAGRVRTIRWGPRLLDVDLIAVGHETVSTTTLRLPHPAAWYRAFVLAPLVEIAPNLPLADRQTDVVTCYDRICQRPLGLHLDLPMTVARELKATLRNRFTESLLRITTGDSAQANPAATWHLIDPQHAPTAWQNAAPGNRFSTMEWKNWSVADIVAVVASAADHPERLAGSIPD